MNMQHKNIIIGTAGHIDHGKTALIKALTGKDTDRLAEEKKRGISIDIGFSCMELNNNLKIGIIDVPGHEKFIKNMLAGAGGVDMALLVIAANEDIMPQTNEHLDILELLDVQYGITVITKTDLVDEEWIELLKEEIQQRTQNTFLENMPIISVSSTTGIGIDELKNSIEKIVEKIPIKNNDGNIFLPIDRTFKIPGHGTVVTGTLINGTINEKEKLTVYPENIDVRVRALQVHDQDSASALPGQRVGINLKGTNLEKIERGNVLASPGSLVNTVFLDCTLKMLKTSPIALQHGDRVRLHLGAKEVIGRAYLLDKEELYPDEEGLIQIKLEEEIAASTNEKFILRRYSPMLTLGGGRILDTKPKRHRKYNKEIIENLTIRKDANPIKIVELVLSNEKQKLIDSAKLIKKTGLSKIQLKAILKQLINEKKVVSIKTGEERFLHINNLKALKQNIKSSLNKYHERYIYRNGMSKEELKTKLFMNLNSGEFNYLLEELKTNSEVVIDNSNIKLKEFSVNYNSSDLNLKNNIIALISKNEFMPPEITEIIKLTADKKRTEMIISAMCYNKELILFEDQFCYTKESIKKCQNILFEHITKNEKITLSEFRNILSTSRKYALPLIEYFDKIGITTRVGDTRILA
jgi:selenocysteine-specific elongation factor